MFKPYDNEIKTSRDTSEEGYCGYYTKEHKEPVVVLQMIICGDMQVIAEIIKESDFNKYFESEEGVCNERQNEN